MTRNICIQCGTVKDTLSAFCSITCQQNNKEKNETYSPLKEQEAGSHYKDMKIQPVEYCHANRLGICESNVIKYVSRHHKKGGIEDLRKARHMIDLLIELEYTNE